MAVRISSRTSIVKRNVSTVKKSNNATSSSKTKSKSSPKVTTAKAITSKLTKKVSNAKTNVATKSNKASSKKVNVSSKNNMKQTTYLKDAPKLYTSSGMAYSYGRPAQSYIEQNKAESKKTKSIINHSTTKSNPVLIPKVTQAPIKKKTTKSSSDVVKIYEPTDSRSGAGKYSYAKKTSPTGAKESTSFIVSSLPIVGDAKDVQEAITGKDLVTGKKLSNTDRIITAAAIVVPVVSGKSINTTKKAVKSPTVKKAVKSGTKKLKQSTEEIIKKAKSGIQKTGKEAVDDVKKKVSTKEKVDVKIDGGTSRDHVKKGGGKEVTRPSWRQSEIDASRDFPDYTEQKSFIIGKEVPYGTKGSVRPDLYKNSNSIDVKNYKIETVSGRNNLARNIEKQYYQRMDNLPKGTKQSVLIDTRGQNITDAELSSLYDDIMRRTKNGISVRFKTM